MNLHDVLLLLSLLVAPAACFSPYSFARQSRMQKFGSKIFSSTTYAIDTESTFTPIFNFSDIAANATANFERIDDAIMGGISLSSIKQNSEEEYARWSGICRLDGGGFCGTRTLPFKSVFRVGNADGFYLLCRLTSDDEPDRRVWKITTRSEASRSDQLYQAMFNLPATGSESDWNLVKINFSDFVQVRGPRVVEGGPKLNSTAGFFQIGLVLSKFKISSGNEQIENFRAGYFELQVKEIGAFRNGKDPLPLEFPGTLQKEEAEKEKPLLLKVLGSVAKIFFSEKRRRRASAMRILKIRGYSTLQAMRFGFAIKARANGWPSALVQSVSSLSKEVLRAILVLTLKVCFFFPFLLIRKVLKSFSKAKAAPAK